MTNEQVAKGFEEVYNNFWNRYKDRQPGRDSEEWERIVTYSAILMRKYPFLRETIAEMVAEFDGRMREREKKCLADAVWVRPE